MVAKTEIQTELDRVEKLRQILANEQDRGVSYEEAVEVGEALLTFFEVLAEDRHGQ